MSDLETKTLEELRAIAKELNIKVHHKAKEASIISQIERQQPHRIEAATDKQVQASQKAQEPEIVNTADDVRAAIKPITDRIQSFEAIFPEDGTWIFRCNGSEESGNLAIPLRVIKMKAEFVSKGKRVMRSMGRDSGDRSYAGTILTV